MEVLWIARCSAEGQQQRDVDEERAPEAAADDSAEEDEGGAFSDAHGCSPLGCEDVPMSECVSGGLVTLKKQCPEGCVLGPIYAAEVA